MRFHITYCICLVLSQVLFIVLQQEFDDVALPTMEATVQTSATFFCAIMVFGGFFVLEYLTAILCITYSEVVALNPDFHHVQSADQVLLQIELAEGHRREQTLDTSFDSSDPPTGLSSRIHEDLEGKHDGAENDMKGMVRNQSIKIVDRIRPPASSGILDKIVFWKTQFVDWSSRQPKTKDVHSLPLLNFSLDVNVEAFERIQKRVEESNGYDSKLYKQCRKGFDMISYCAAGAIMCPNSASEMHGAQGWYGSSDSGVISYWELGITILSVIEVIFHFGLSSARIESRRAGVEPSDEQAQSGENWIILSIFLVDMTVKLIAFRTPAAYLKPTLNKIDACTTTAEFIGMLTWKHPNLAGFRILRWITVMALARNISSFHQLTDRAFGSPAESMVVVIVIIVFTFAVALFGQQSFAGADWTDYPRPYFNTFYASVVSIIELSSNSGLLSMILQGYTVGKVTSVYLMCAIVFVNLLLMRMMIPFMLQKCDEPEMFKIRYQIFFGRVLGDDAHIWTNTKEHVQMLAFFKDFNSPEHDEAAFLSKVNSRPPNDVEQNCPDPSDEGCENGTDGLRADIAPHQVKLEDRLKTIRNATRAWHAYGKLAYGMTEHVLSETNHSKKAIIKKLAYKATSSKFYEPIISCAVIAACYVFADDKLWEFSAEFRILLRWLFIAFFCTEILTKLWLSYGKSLEKKMYYKDPMFIVDLLAMFGLLNVAILGRPSNRGLSNLRFFQLFRVMHGLAVIPDIRLAYERLWAVSALIFYCLLLIFCLVIAFTMFAMPLFGGLFARCDDFVANLSECSGVSYLTAGNPDEQVYILRHRVWETPTENFDTVTNGFGTAFALFLNFGWGNVINQSMSVTSAGIQPLRYATGTMGLVFITYQFCAMILRQLLIAMTINSLKITSGSGFLTDDQKTWSATLRMCQSKCTAYMSRGMPGGKGLEAAISLKRHPYFRMLVEFTIVINVITMLCVSYGASKLQEDIMQYINFACLIVYYVEMIVALLAQVHVYFLSGWNLFDMLINIVSTIDLYFWFTDVDGAEPSFEILSLRSARVLRLVKLASRSPQLSILLNFSIKAMKSCIGCYMLWTSLIVIFAIPANQMFSGIRQGYTIDDASYSNFNSWQHSMLHLFRIAVQDNFVYEADELNVQAPYCTVVNQTAVDDSEGRSSLQSDCGPDHVSVWMFFTCFSAFSRIVIVPFIAGCGNSTT
jgi:hypothetical protein